METELSYSHEALVDGDETITVEVRAEEEDPTFKKGCPVCGRKIEDAGFKFKQPFPAAPAHAVVDPVVAYDENDFSEEIRRIDQACQAVQNAGIVRRLQEQDDGLALEAAIAASLEEQEDGPAPAPADPELEEAIRMSLQDQRPRSRSQSWEEWVRFLFSKRR